MVRTNFGSWIHYLRPQWIFSRVSCQRIFMIFKNEIFRVNPTFASFENISMVRSYELCDPWPLNIPNKNRWSVFTFAKQNKWDFYMFEQKFRVLCRVIFFVRIVCQTLNRKKHRIKQLGRFLTRTGWQLKKSILTILFWLLCSILTAILLTAMLFTNIWLSMDRVRSLLIKILMKRQS